MSELEHQFLPADVLGLAAPVRRLLAARPVDDALPEILAPRSAADLAPPPDPLAADERERLAGDLERALAPLAPPVAALDRVRALAAPGASVVLACTDPRFLGGTLAQLYLALQAVRVADELERTWSAPVAPVLWVREDVEPPADEPPLAARSAARGQAVLLNENLDLTRIGLAGLGPGSISPFGVPLSDAVHRLGGIRAVLGELLWKGPHQGEALERFLPVEGESLGRAFARTLSDLCGQRGLLVLEPDALRAETSRALARVVGADPQADLERGRRALAGSAPELVPEPGVLVLDRAGGPAAPLRGLRAGGEGFRYDEEPGSRTPAELAAEIVQEPERWGAAAPLLPAVLELVLPVAAHVSPWQELGAHSVLGPLRRTLGLRRPAFVPAPSCTLLEPEVARSLEKLGLTLEQALRERAAAARGALPEDEPEDEEGGGEGPEGARAAAALRAALERALAELRGALPAVGAVDRGLALQLRRDADRVGAQIEKLARKVERVERNRAGKSGRHARRLDGALFPSGRPQEEVLGPLPFVARHGAAWIDALADELEPFPCEHLALRFAAHGGRNRAE